MVDLTPEQTDVVKSVDLEDGIYVVDAAAGSGKTTTAIKVIEEYVKHNPQSSVLCLVRGRDMKIKLEKELGHLNNVDCFTVHSYAFNKFRKIKPIWKITESKKDLFDQIGEIKALAPEFKYVSANDINNLFCSYYSNDKFKTVDSYVVHLLKDRRALQSAALSVRASEKTLDCFNFVYSTMQSKNIYTHDMYLKEYTLNYNDETYYDLVVIDEAQDLNKYMCILLDRISCHKMYLVGDEKQRLFMWDNCVNAMAMYRKKAKKSFSLSKSFRQNEDVIETSNHLISYLNPSCMNNTPAVPGHNLYKLPKNFTKATLFRTNAAMVLQAINKLCKDKDVKIIFKGFDNTSVKSVLGSRLNYIFAFLDIDGCTRTREKLENRYKTWTNGKIPFILEDLIEEARNSGIDIHKYIELNSNILEPELRQSYRLYTSMTKTYFKVEGCLQLLEYNLKRDEHDVSEIEEYSTVHKAKGFEWDFVILGDDMWDFDKIGDFSIAYVGTTRAKIKCDYSALNKTMERYDEYKEYLNWYPSEDGWKGDLQEDLAVAKAKIFLKEYVTNIDEVKIAEHILAMKDMVQTKAIRKGYVYNKDKFEKEACFYLNKYNVGLASVTY